MTNLLWKTKKSVRNVESAPFPSEPEFERVVFETPEILEDIFLLKRQIRGGGKTGIPDIVGIDKDGNVCIIEMKNVAVDASIIPQVLEYALWAENNPDSIRALWLECRDKPDDIEVHWDEYDVRIIIIAPQIHRSTLESVKRINYQTELIEVKRWKESNNEFLLVQRLTGDEVKPKVRPVSGMEVYDAAFYKRERNPQSAEQFISYVKEVERLLKKEDIKLETKFNKHYCGFKSGFFNAFGIKWIGTKSFAFFFKMSREEAKKFKLPMTRYEDLWKEAVYLIEPGKTKVKNFTNMLKFCYKKVV
jgi:hypothetical protein